jgi:hydrogenase nickel incorporation protein HypB
MQELSIVLSIIAEIGDESEAHDLHDVEIAHLKYPSIFNSSDVAIVTKMDMAEAAEFDMAAARRNIESMPPGMQIFEVSDKTGSGMQTVFQIRHNQFSYSREKDPGLQVEANA